MFSKGINIKSCVAVSAAIVGSYLAWKLVNRRRRPKILSIEELEKAQWKRVGNVKKIWVYPVKSCAPLELYLALAVQPGFMEITSALRDRSFMVVNDTPSLSMVTGRMCPQMVLIKPTIEESGDLTLSYPGLDPITVTKAQRQKGTIKQSKVWDSPVEGVDCGDAVAAWLQKVLNRAVRLLYFVDDLNKSTRRTTAKIPVDLPLLKPDDTCVYGDGAAFLMLSSESVEQLQQQSPRKDVTALQFRPNILIESDPTSSCRQLRPHQEDEWSYIKVGERAVFRNLFPCTRCVFTCVDPITGVKDKNLEPLHTLKRTRMTEPWPEPLFGINLGLDRRGVVRENDPVYILA